MKHGDEYILYPHGLRLLPNQAATLGTADKGICWGVWVEGKGGKGKARFSRRSDDPALGSHQGPHLVLSPIHPDIWPAAFTVEIRARRVPGTLWTLLDTLRDMGLNIMSIESASAAYDLSIIRAICEHHTLSGEIQMEVARLDESLAKLASQMTRDPDDPGNKPIRDEIDTLRRKAMRRIGRWHVAVACAVESLVWLHDCRLRELGGVGAIEGRIPFLHDRSRILGANPSFQNRTIATDSYLHKCVDLDAFGTGNAHAKLQDLIQEALSTRAKNADAKIESELMDPELSEAERALMRRHGTLAESRVRAAGSSVEEELSRVWARGSRMPVRVAPLISLAYARLSRHLDRPPRKFRYSASTHTLAPVDGAADRDGARPMISRIHDDLVEMGRVDLNDRFLFQSPLIALGYFNEQERFLRLRFMQDWFASCVAYEIEIKYKWERGESNDVRPIGVLASIIRRLYDAAFTIERVENITLQQQWDGDNPGARTNLLSEEGVVRIIASSGTSKYSEDVEARVSSTADVKLCVLEAAGPLRKANVELIIVSVSPLSQGIRTRHRD